MRHGESVSHITGAFARGFLLSRMSRFHAELPDVDLWLDTSERKVDFRTDEVDILITQAEGVAAHGTIDSHLMDDERVPIAAPALMASMGGLPAADNIAGWPLLHDESEVTWREWFFKSGRPAVDTVSGSNFSELVVLDGPSFSQSAYRMHCDLRTYDDATGKSSRSTSLNWPAAVAGSTASRSSNRFERGSKREPT